jgi:hypothetical protein
MRLPTNAETTVDSQTTRRRRWFGELVHFYSGGADQVAPKLPEFERRPFALGEIPQAKEDLLTAALPSGENRFWDVIVRVPTSEDERETPVGVVSKAYKLVQHRELFEKAREAVKNADINLAEVTVNVATSAYESRMALSFILPDRFGFDPGDNEKVALQLLCMNSVDGLFRLTVMMGWFRFVCTNGVIVGTSRLGQRLLHNESLRLPDLTKVLSEGIRVAEKEKDAYEQWIQTPVSNQQLISWVDGPLRKKWGVLAAARAYLICRHGCDGKFVNPFERALPHQKQMKVTKPVPGAPQKPANAYSVCQALAWVAKERRDLQEQVDGMREIPGLMSKLIQSAPRTSQLQLRLKDA